MVRLQRVGKEDFARLQRMAIAFHGEDSSPPVAQQEAAALMLSLGADVADRLSWLIERDGHYVGYAVAATPEDGAREAHVEELYVAPTFRGLGLARAILPELEAALSALDCRRIVIPVDGADTCACLFYRSIGYSPSSAGEFAKVLTLRDV